MQNITAVRYSWYYKDNYQVNTFGDFVHGESTATESFDGCLFGLYGNLNSADGQFIDVGFQYKYPFLFRCATDEPNNQKCTCQGKVYFGPYKSKDESQILDFE